MVLCQCNKPTALFVQKKNRATNLPSIVQLTYRVGLWLSTGGCFHGHHFLSLFCSVLLCSYVSILGGFRQLNVFVQQTYCRPSIVQQTYRSSPALPVSYRAANLPPLTRIFFVLETTFLGLNSVVTGSYEALMQASKALFPRSKPTVTLVAIVQ